MTRRTIASLALALSLGGLGCTTTGPKDTVAEAVLSAPLKRTAPKLLDTQLKPEQLSTACALAEAAAEARLKAVVEVPDASRTFSNTVLGIERAMADYTDTVGRLMFLKEMHPDALVRKAGAECEVRASKFTVQVGARKALYAAVKSWRDGPGKAEQLDASDARLVELMFRDFRRNGLELADAQRERLVAIRERLSELGSQYAAHLSENVDTIEATDAELEGMPAEWKARLKKAPSGKFIVTTKYPDVFPVMESCKVEATRKRMFLAFNGREAKSNLPLLTEAISLRDEAAKLLGFATHADFITDDRMARSSKTVADFLGKLRTSLVPGRDGLVQQLTALKRLESKDPQAVVQDWDWTYFLTVLKKGSYAVDDEEVRAHFPADRVLEGMLATYSELLGVRIAPVKDAQVWADGVTLYEIRDARGGELLANFYLDLFPREGKYGHAACFSLGLARLEEDGTYTSPLSALLVNFSPPENGKVARLSLKEVTTLFHEFGHVVHASLTTARWASMSGTNTAVDFVEAPSQMLENWVFEPEVLARISRDPADPTKPMAEPLVRKLIAARTYDAGIRYTRQVFLATFDQALHTRGAKVDPDAVEHELRAQVMGWPPVADEHFAANFGHLMGGYDAGYYGYLWSEVFAADMFARFKREGVMSPQVGADYRRHILEQGRSVEPSVLLERFLGRAPSDEAFLHHVGLKK